MSDRASWDWDDEGDTDDARDRDAEIANGGWWEGDERNYVIDDDPEEPEP